MILFAEQFCCLCGSSLSENPDHTFKRVSAGIEAPKGRVSETRLDTSEALSIYFGHVSDLINRQEHGVAKSGDPLVWDDARAVVFNTAFVMSELARLVPEERPG